MFAARYFNPRYWASRFWAKVGATGTAVVVHRLRGLRCVVPSVTTHNLRVPAAPAAACRVPSVPTLTLRG
jgi:hypothetical protein